LRAAGRGGRAAGGAKSPQKEQADKMMNATATLKQYAVGYLVILRADNGEWEPFFAKYMAAAIGRALVFAAKNDWHIETPDGGW
jgi:hypothetical protein